MIKLSSYLKTIGIILIIAIFVPLTAHAQSGVTINVKDSPIKSVIKQITKQSHYRFVYTSKLDIDKYKATVNSKNDPINVLLSKIFTPVNIKYQIKGNQIILTAEEVVSGKKVKINGIVVDDTNEPLPGVYIITPTGENTTSNANGSFEIIVNENENITLQYLGMIDAVVKPDPKRNMNIIMKPDVVALDDIVVTGYQSLSKERATGAFNTIKAEQLEKPSSNIAQRLVGTTAGLQSTTDAEGNVSFQIRGKTSLMTNTQPLLVVDGFGSN